MNRRHAAWLVLAAWIGVLGWNARRELFRPEAERLALGAATLPPGAAYFTIDSGDRPAGMASLEVDTLPGRTGFHLLEQVTLRLPGLGAAGEVETRTDTWLGPGITLDSLVRRTVRGGDTTRVQMLRRGDSLRWEAAGDTVVQGLPAGAALLTDASWPLRFAAVGGAATGEERRVFIADPVTGGIRDLTLRTLAVDTRSFPDSADTDSLTGRWFVAGRDTVRAWRVSRAGAGGGTPAGDAWVDEDGRYVETELPGGLRMRRTAFELAFFRETE